MKTLLLKIEAFLRHLARMSPQQKKEHSAEIGELSQFYADNLEPVIDTLDDDEE